MNNKHMYRRENNYTIGLFLFFFFRLTKPLSFADCVGDELPWGWEAAYDPQIGVYYIDHINRKYFSICPIVYIRRLALIRLS